MRFKALMIMNMKITVCRMEAAGFSTTTVMMYQTIWYKIPEEGNLQTYTVFPVM
jgi:hypothetical protein